MSGESTSAADARTVAGPVRQRTGDDATTAPPRPVDGEAAWREYVAAARQLDGVRRGATTAATEQARAVQAAREELTGVRERLASQRSRLRESGVPPITLVPAPPELSEAAREMLAGPTAVLTALRAARDRADAADTLLAARGPLPVATWPPRIRNLLVYGPLALVVPLLQVAVYAAAGTGPASLVALVCGLPMPAVAFLAGWIGVGRLFGRVPNRLPGQFSVRNGGPGPAATVDNPAANDPAPETDAAAARASDPAVETTAASPAANAGATAGRTAAFVPEREPFGGGRLDRTPRWGALVCLVPAVLATAGIVLAMLAG